MTKAPISLQDLRRSLYVKAKAEPSWRFWGLYVHVCKTETLREAYQMARSNDGAPGIDGVTFEAIAKALAPKALAGALAGTDGAITFKRAALCVADATVAIPSPQLPSGTLLCRSSSQRCDYFRIGDDPIETRNATPCPAWKPALACWRLSRHESQLLDLATSKTFGRLGSIEPRKTSGAVGTKLPLRNPSLPLFTGVD